MTRIGDSYRALGPLRFFALMGGLFAYVGLGLWLEEVTRFDHDYGFTCHGKGCLVVEIWHSPDLLRHGGGYEFAEFCWLWSMPAFVVGSLIWAQLKKRRTIKFSFFDDSPGPRI